MSFHPLLLERYNTENSAETRLGHTAMRNSSKTVALAGLLLTFTHPLHADEQMVPLAASGEWMTMAHKPSIIAPADVCLALNVVSGVALWAGQGDVQLRVINKAWSLPAGVSGVVSVALPNWNATLDIADNTDTMVSVSLDGEQQTALFRAMDKSNSMAVVVGKARPIQVSLSGSTRATNAFRTCAGLKGDSSDPGSNPFK
jgi:hypothetical protein